jgi:hypothetical protein
MRQRSAVCTGLWGKCWNSSQSSGGIQHAHNKWQLDCWYVHSCDTCCCGIYRTCYNFAIDSDTVTALMLTVLTRMYRILYLLLALVCRTFTSAALEDVAAPTATKVKAAARGRDGWTAAQFADAALLLLNSTDNAVTTEQMEQRLGRHLTDDVDQQCGRGEATLEALVKANRLSLRPYSKWALDIPRARFQAKAVIVTAPSAVDLDMKHMRSQLEQTVQKWEQRRQVCSVVASVHIIDHTVIAHCVLVCFIVCS